MFESTIGVFQELITPLRLLFLSSIYLPGTLLSLLHARQFSALISPSRIKDAWFARFWSVYGSVMKEFIAPIVAPMLGLAEGVVLDIGPGNGEWIGRFNLDKVTKIYGVEPNKDHHDALRRRIKEEGLSDVYEIVPVRAEDLGSKWVREGEVDSIITVQCLCSVDNPQGMITSLYSYLKPGGRWIVYEHVVTNKGGFVAFYQWAIDFIWPHFIGGCSLTRDSEKWLREVGTWSEIDLSQPDGEPHYKVLPHVSGFLRK